VQVKTARYFPDGQRVLEIGNATGANGPRLWVQDVSDGKPK
jgi:hypothetical protein